MHTNSIAQPPSCNPKVSAAEGAEVSCRIRSVRVGVRVRVRVRARARARARVRARVRGSLGLA